MYGKQKRNSYAKAFVAGAKALSYAARKSAQRSMRGTPSLRQWMAAGSKRNRSKIVSKNRKMSAALSGAVASKSAGFFGKGISKKYYKKKKQIRRSRDGINKTIEAAKVITATDCSWIGHSTFPRGEYIYVIGQLLFQYICRKQGGEPQTAYQFMRCFADGDGIDVEGKTTPSSGISGATYVVPVGGANMDLFASWFCDNSRPWTNNREFQFTRCRCTTTATETHVDFNLDAFYVNIYAKGTLKLQNRSKNGDNSETDVVDNVPLYGKSYFGKGTGIHMKVPYNPNTQFAIVCESDNEFGTIIGSDFENQVKEPPQPSDFLNISYSGKAHLDPSQIKTSTITSTIKNRINVLWPFLTPPVSPINTGTANGGPATARQRSLGVFRVFALEKMIDTGSAQPITVAFEHNLEISASAYYRASRGIVKQFKRQVLV